MKYDFTSIMNRHGKDAIAVDSGGQMNGVAPEAPIPGVDVIPMWVADMDFRTAPFVIDALKKRQEHEVLGYTFACKEWAESIINWLKERQG